MFTRDPVSKAIINNEDSYYKAIVARRQDKKKNNELESELDSLRNELSNIKEALTKRQNFSLIIKNLWSAMSDELDVISKNENYPFFFRQNIWSLIQVDRTIIILKENYAKGMNDCIPNNWEDIVNINDLTNDQNFMQIYRSHGGKSPVDAYDVPIYSNAFENGGVALTFWGSENLNELEGKEKSVFVGYINNNRVYEYLLIPQNYTVVHRLKIFDVSYLFILEIR